jgi:hypothetical protein
MTSEDKQLAYREERAETAMSKCTIKEVELVIKKQDENRH